MQHGARQAFAGAEHIDARALDERRDRRIGDRPRVLEAQHLAVDPEVAAAGEALGFADRAHHAFQAGGRVLGGGEQARHLVLQAQHLLGALLLGDVASHAAVAGEAAVGVEQRFAAHPHVAHAAVEHRAPHQEIVERLARIEQRAVRVPAAFDLEAGVPARLADQALLQLGVAAGDVAALEAREAVCAVELPVPVGGKVGERAEARFAVAHRALGCRASEKLADLRADRAQRLPQALVGLADAPRGEFEYPGELSAGAHREQQRCLQAAFARELHAADARVLDRLGRPDRLARLPDRADQALPGTEGEAARAFDEALRARNAGRGPARILAQHVAGFVRRPELRAIPAEHLARRLQRAAQSLGRARRLGEAQRNRVVELEQLLDALLLGDVAADAAIAEEASLGIEHRLAADADVAARAVGEGAPHEHVAERRALLEHDLVRLPAALDLDAGFPALLADQAVGARLLFGRVAAHLDAREAQLGVLLPVPVGGEAEERRRARRGLAAPRHLACLGRA